MTRFRIPILVGGPAHGEHVAVPAGLAHYKHPTDPDGFTIYRLETLIGPHRAEPLVEVYIHEKMTLADGERAAWAALVEMASRA
jgi:hypothetical protein